MTAPISYDRVKWIEQRLQVIERCITLLTARPTFYASKASLSSNVNMFTVAEQFKLERMQLIVELDALTDMEVTP